MSHWGRMIQKQLPRFVILSVLVALLSVSLFAAPVFAQDGGEGEEDPHVPVVMQTTDTLRMRAAPSTASQIYAVSPINTQITAIAISPNYRWIRTTINGQGGWMARQYLAEVSGDVATLPVSSEYVAPAVVTASQYVPVNTVVVRTLQGTFMRMDPTADPTTIEGVLDPEWNVITTVPVGAEMSARAITPDGLWVFVQYGNLRGWIKGQYLNVINGTYDYLRPPGIVYDADGIYFAADLTTVNPGGCVILRWSLDGPGSVHYKARNSFGHGAAEECLFETTQFKLLVVRPGNVILERVITIQVLTTEVDFFATPEEIGPGQCATLTWNTQAVREAYLDGVAVEVSSNQQVCPSQTTEYNFRAYGLDDTLIDRSVVVTVNELATPSPGDVVSINFYANNLFISSGECVTVNWNVTGAKQTFYQGGEVGPVGSSQECPGATSTYVLRVFSIDNRTLEQTLVITVN